MLNLNLCRPKSFGPWPGWPTKWGYPLSTGSKTPIKSGCPRANLVGPELRPDRNRYGPIILGLPPRKPIHHPRDFFQLTFQCLRFVQTITALGSTSNPNLFSLPTFSPHRPHRRRPVRCPAPAPRSVAVHTRHAATRRKRRRLPRAAPPPAPAPRALLPAPPPPPARCTAAACLRVLRHRRSRRRCR